MDSRLVDLPLPGALPRVDVHVHRGLTFTVLPVERVRVRIVSAIGTSAGCVGMILSTIELRDSDANRTPRMPRSHRESFLEKMAAVPAPLPVGHKRLRAKIWSSRLPLRVTIWESYARMLRASGNTKKGFHRGLAAKRDSKGVQRVIILIDRGPGQQTCRSLSRQQQRALIVFRVLSGA